MAWTIVLGALGVVAILAALVVAFVLHARAEKRRREALAAWATAQGWSYLPRDRSERPGRYAGFTPFGAGHSRYASDCIFGAQDGVGFDAFEYHYAVTSHNGKTTTTHHYFFRICAVHMPLPAPALSIQPEHLGHKIFDALGGEDIDFESDEFSRRFWVTCKDRRFAYDVIHPRMMEHLLGQGGRHWQWAGHTLLLHERGRRISPEVVERLLGLARGFRDQLPPHLVAAAPKQAWKPA